MTTMPGRRTRRSHRAAERSLLGSSVLSAVGPNMEYRLVRTRGTGYAVRDFSHACLIKLADFPELPLRTHTCETVKAGHSALIVRTEFPVGGETVSAAYKRVRRRSWLKRMLGFFRPSPCLKNFRLGLELLRRGVPTARPLAAIVPPRMSLSTESYLATEWIDHATNLYNWTARLPLVPATQRRLDLAAGAAAVGGLLGRMHGAGVAHRDLKPGNILVRTRRGTIDALVVDLDGVSLYHHVSNRLRAKNVSRLVVSLIALYPFVTRTVLLRGLRAYLNAAGEAQSTWKTVWREIAAHARRRSASLAHA